LLQASQALRQVVDRAAIFLEDDVLGRCGADDLREPSERGGTPMGATGIADIVTQQEGFEPDLGRFEVLGGVFTGSSQVTNGFIFEFGDLDRGEITRAPQASELDSVTAVGFDAIASLFRDQRRSDDPTGMAFLTEVSIGPVATGTGFVDEDELVSLGLKLAPELIEVGWSGPDRAEVSDFSTVIGSDIGDRDGVLVHIQTDDKRSGHGRLCHS
jgi:hypothetical protein